MMRLSKLNTDYRLKHRLMMLVMRVLSGQPVPDVVRMHYYRYDFFGKHIGALFQEAMRGPSEWSIFDREIMASFVSSLNQCVF
jgi:hypothetical protein